MRPLPTAPTALACLMLALLLSACSNRETPAVPQPTAASATPAAEKPAEPVPPVDPVRAAFRKAPAYTLSCTGTFSVTTGSETKGGSHAFSMTVDPAEDVAYMFDFVSTGYFNSRHRAMNNEISRISNVSDERIFIGSFELNRRTGKYTFDGDFTVGTCEKAENVTPVPQQKF